MCAACSHPVAGAPATRLLYIAVVTLVVGVIAGLILFVAPPRLSSESRSAATHGTAVATPVRGGLAPATPAAVGNPSATPAPALETYTVQAGDTLNTIAARYATTADAIRAANPGVDPRGLQVGQQLAIPLSR